MGYDNILYANVFSPALSTMYHDTLWKEGSFKYSIQARKWQIPEYERDDRARAYDPGISQEDIKR